MSEPKMYKAQVHIRWHNRAEGAGVDCPPGTVVSFDADDFRERPGDRNGALVSLENVLARGLFVEFDPSKAGDPDYMSRDEMLYFLRKHEAPGADDLAHNTDIGTVRQVMVEYLAAQGKPPPKAARRRRGGG